MGFQIKTLENTPFGRLRCYANERRAVAHLNKHVLSAPESDVWKLLLEDYEGVVGPSADDRFHFATKMLQQPFRAQPLYDLYVNAIKAALNDAVEFDWHASPDGGDGVAIGLSGIVIIVNAARDPSTLRTAFLPNQRRAPRPRDKANCYEKPLCRETDRAPIATGDNRRFSGQDRVRGARRRRLEERPRLERIYFECFRPAKRFVSRSHYLDSDPMKRGKPSGEAALLLDPIRSTLDDVDDVVSVESNPSAPPNRKINFQCWHHLWKRSPNNDGVSI